MIERTMIEQAYETLRLPSFVPLHQIKAQYRRLALTHHPDRVSGASAKKAAHDAFSRISAAYELLTNRNRFSTCTKNNSILYGCFSDPYHLFRNTFHGAAAPTQDFPSPYGGNAVSPTIGFLTVDPAVPVPKRDINQVTPPSSPTHPTKRIKVHHEPPPMMLVRRSIKRDAYAVEDDEDMDAHFCNQGSSKRTRFSVCTF